MIPLSHKIHIIAHKLQIRATVILEDNFDLSFSGYVFLWILLKHKNISQDDLSKFAGISPAATSKRIDTLLKKGLIELSVNPDNRRQHIVRPTNKAKVVVKKASTLLENDFSDVIAVLKNKSLFESELDSVLLVLMGDCKVE